MHDNCQWLILGNRYGSLIGISPQDEGELLYYQDVEFEILGEDLSDEGAILRAAARFGREHFTSDALERLERAEARSKKN